VKLTKNQLKELVKEALLERISEEDKLKVVQKKDDSGPKKATTNIKDNPFDDEEEEKEKTDESVSKRFTVKEVQRWMKTLEENRYKRVYNSDARRVAWLVNNNLSEDYESMPVSMRKKWSKAQYGRERYLAKEFLKSKSEQLSEAITGADRKTLLVFVREIIQNLKKAGAKKPSKAIGRGVLSIMRAMTYTPDNANYKQYKKYFPKKYNSKLVQKHLKNFHNQNDKVQVTLVQQAMNNVLGEGTLREQIREIIKEQLNEAKMVNLLLPIKDRPKVVDILQRKLNLKVTKHFEYGGKKGKNFVIELDKKFKNKFLELLVSNNIKVRG